jgi:hypothetical protein
MHKRFEANDPTGAETNVAVNGGKRENCFSTNASSATGFTSPTSWLALGIFASHFRAQLEFRLYLEGCGMTYASRLFAILESDFY